MHGRGGMKEKIYHIVHLRLGTRSASATIEARKRNQSSIFAAPKVLLKCFLLLLRTQSLRSAMGRPEDYVQDGYFLSLSYKRPNRHAARAVLNKLVASDCDIQQKSPLFRLRPSEVRGVIFSLVFQPTVHQATAEATKASLEGVFKRELQGNRVERTHATVDTALFSRVD
ncbi:uncharacterized protein LY89DRAFT_507884 [Mollisia scopiformis]|uniref:Uncharacterized protein n=1 Tax=Mollisia scopiformis TaxID=149040 RepID=A0A194XFF7_MOLSC|nr:uncharacterized protein LY89DRAFT_507884 [Mollisia scopiformis]KUJ18925.1 hypothetical protein LY89DRAFT_507884 [Mollisia scopiformis]